MDTDGIGEYIESNNISVREGGPQVIYFYNWTDRAQGPMVFGVGIPVNPQCKSSDDNKYVVKDYPAMKFASIVYEGPFPHEPNSGWGNNDWERRAKEAGLVYTEKIYHHFDFENNRHITEIQISIE